MGLPLLLPLLLLLASLQAGEWPELSCSARDPRTWFRCMWVEMKGRLSPAASNHNDLIMIIIDFRKQDVELVKKTLYVCADVRFLTK